MVEAVVCSAYCPCNGLDYTLLRFLAIMMYGLILEIAMLFSNVVAFQHETVSVSGEFVSLDCDMS